MLILEIEQKNRRLITEQWNDPRWMLIEQKHIVPFVTSLEKYITEAELTPDQIKSLFTSVEKQATDSGSNRTLAGKGVDATKWIDSQVKKLGASLQSSGPVTNLDQKVEDLKIKIGAKDTKTVKLIQGVSDWAKANPKKASVAVGILTAAAAMTAGPLGGAVVGFLTRATKDLLQGSKLSTAAGKSVKTAAIGAIAGAIADNVDFSKPEVEGGPAEIQASISTDDIQADGADAAEILASVDENTFRTQMASELLDKQMELTGGYPSQEMIDKIVKSITIEGEYPNNFKANLSGNFIRGEIYLTPEEYQKFNEFVNTLPGEDGIMKLLGDEATEWIKNNVEGAEAQMQASYSPPLSDEDVNSMIQNAPKQSVSLNSTPTAESVILSQRQVIKLTEGIMDTLKKAGKTVAGKAKTAASNVVKKGVGAAQQVGKNITTKVTADKLMSAWKKAGSPADSNKVYQVMRNAGVSDEVMKPVFDTMKIPFIKGAPRNVQAAPTDTGPSAMAMRTPKSNQTPGAQQQPQATAPAQAQQQPQATAPAQAQQQPQATAPAQAPAQQQPQSASPATAPGAQQQPQAAAPAAQAQEETETMEQYIVRWFDAYMQGVAWNEYEPKINEIAKQIMSSYQQDKGKAGIAQLANIAWEATLKSTDGKTPRGAKNVPGLNNPTSTGNSTTERDYKKQTDWLENLRASDKTKYTEFINKATAYLTKNREQYKNPLPVSGTKMDNDELRVIGRFNLLSKGNRDPDYAQALQAAGYTRL
jgi:hypothetical protein